MTDPADTRVRIQHLLAAADASWDSGDYGIAAALFQAAMVGEIKLSIDNLVEVGLLSQIQRESVST